MGREASGWELPEHRAEAFRACKWAIDELKQITPIWKLEHTPEGEVWVEEHP